MICKFQGLFVHFLNGVSWNTKVVNSDEVQPIYFFFSCLCFGVMFKKPLINSISWTSIFFYKLHSFILYICVLWYEVGSPVLPFVDTWLFRHRLLRKLLFPCLNVSTPCWKSIFHKHNGLFLDSQFYSIDLYVYLRPISHCLISVIWKKVLKLGSVCRKVPQLFQDYFGNSGSLEHPWI